MSKCLVRLPPSFSMGVTTAPNVSKPQNGSGETLTITCCNCGMPSSIEWAQRIHTRPQPAGVPFYPFLVDSKSPQAGVHIITQEDGTTYLCAFCHASLEAQWNSFEKRNVPTNERYYKTNNFICAVCGVQTYRKRVRALPFKDFPFLTKERPPGSLILRNHPLAVVCLDCSETLWAQSAEYDRWGLPLQKRHFNWMSRPPPPEGSMEATVARLPSGETQLPRCPPTEPLVIRRKDAPRVANLSNTESEFSHKQDIHPLQSGHHLESTQSYKKTSHSSRSESLGKLSVAETGSSSPVNNRSSNSSYGNLPDLLDATVPVVIVAPMTTVTPSSSRKDLRLQPSNFMPMTNAEAQRASYQPEAAGIGSCTMFPSKIDRGNLGICGGTNHSEQFSFSNENNHAMTMGHPHHLMDRLAPFPWVPPLPISNSDYRRYQEYLESTSSDSYKSAVESYFSQPHPHPLLQATESRRSSEPGISHVSQSRVPAAIYRTSLIPPAHLDHASTSLATIYSANSNIFANSTEPEEPSRKRSGKPISPPSLPKMPALSSSTSKSNFGAIPKLVRHLNLAREAESNGRYIVSESEYLARRAEENRYRKNSSPPPFPTESRTKVNAEQNTAMDLSVVTAGSSYTSSGMSHQNVEQIRLPNARTRKLGLAAPQQPTQTRNSNSFFIEHLCRENISPSTALGRVSDSSKDVSKEQEFESRDSVIVSLKTSPSISLRRETPTIIADHSISNDAKGVEDKKVDEVASPKLVGVGLCPQTVSSHVEPIAQTSSFVQSFCNIEIHPEGISSPKCTSKSETTPSELTLSPNSGKELRSETQAEEEMFEKARLDFQNEQAVKHAKEKMKYENKANFLKNFQLITPEEKTDIDLKLLASRYNRKTLPPIQFRPEEVLNEETPMSEEIEKHVLITALEDPSLKKTASDPELLSFMRDLGMYPVSKVEKYRREENWRLVLAERLLRKKRGLEYCGARMPWDTMSNISKHLLPCEGPIFKRRNSIPPVSGRRRMRTLSLKLPSTLSPCNGVHSADLLKTVELNDSNKTKEVNVTKTDLPEVSCLELPNNNFGNDVLRGKANLSRQPVISYPKYIPSYIASIPQKKTTTTSSFASQTQENSKTTHSQFSAKDSPAVSSPSGTPLVINQANGVEKETSPACIIDRIIQRSISCWKETKEEIESLVKSSCEAKMERRMPIVELRKLRQSLNSQQLEMKSTVKLLKRFTSE